MSNNRLEQVLQGKEGNTIYPFFWMHGEDHEVLREELDKIYDCNIRGICIEARPHPDFGGASWWSDMDFIMEYAKEHDMKLWLLDDDHFPGVQALPQPALLLPLAPLLLEAQRV